MPNLAKDIAFDGWFDKLVEEADKWENSQKYIAGYPIEYYNIQKKKFGPLENNAAFDNVVLRNSGIINGTKQQY